MCQSRKQRTQAKKQTQTIRQVQPRETPSPIYKMKMPSTTNASLFHVPEAYKIKEKVRSLANTNETRSIANSQLDSSMYKQHFDEHKDDINIAEINKNVNAMIDSDNNKEVEDYLDKSRKLDTTESLISLKDGNEQHKSVKVNRIRIPFIQSQASVARIDLLININMLPAAKRLFHLHRRQGHHFSIDMYNKILKAFVEQDYSWTDIALLLHSMEIDQVEKNTFTNVILLCDCEKHNRFDRKAALERELEHVSVEEQAQIKRLINVGRGTATPTECDDQNEMSSMPGMEDTNYHNEFETSSIPGLEGCNYRELIQDRSNLEREGIKRIRSIETLQSTKTDAKKIDQYHQYIREWRQQFIEIFNLQLKAWREGAGIKNKAGLELVSALSAEEHADIIFEEFLPLLARTKFGLPMNSFCAGLGERIYQTTRFKCTKVSHREAVLVATEYLRTPALNERERLRELSKKLTNSLNEDTQSTYLLAPWPFRMNVLSAATVFDILKKVAMVSVGNDNEGRIEPVIHHQCEFVKSKKLGILKVHPIVHSLYSSLAKRDGMLTFQYREIPHLIPPRPWTSKDNGSSWFVNEHLIRGFMDRYSSNHINKSSNEGKMDRLYDSINYLGSCPWRVNGPVLDVITELFLGDGNDKLQITEPLDRLDKNDPSYGKIYREQYSLHTTLLYKLSIAEHYREKVFWTPLNLDFRGRVYPIAPHLNIVGNDVSRGIMHFALGKPLGPNGLWWLKVNLANLHGEKAKASLDDRTAFIDQQIEMVLDSADHPLTGCKWWQTAEDPFQALACCFEIRNALRLDDPSKYVCHLQVIQDGTCNGLQHYAALGRDLYGARQVNLVNSDKPQDVYNEVALIVENIRVKEAADGVPEAQLLEGRICRRVVKQTVMTIVYGVTFHGANLQVKRQIENCNSIDQSKLSIYITKKVFYAVEELFTSAKEIQRWLTSCASQIARSENTVDWVTPLGLPALQPYHRPKRNSSFGTPIQNVNFSTRFDETRRPNISKQKGAFAPNFVHSLDSTHMLMTSLRCRDAGLTFASVHDSYWTHACDVPIMNKFCREEFVSLHKQPILDDLRNHLLKFDGLNMSLTFTPPGAEKRYFVEIDDLPTRGDLDINEVLKSTYFFS